MKKLLLAGLIFGIAHPALAQVPYDPPSAVKAAPNVFLILDANRTTLISGGSCTGSSCHFEGVGGGRSTGNASLYQNGETRLSLARRVLTGGWGWNTASTYGPSGGSADGFVRPDGIMDQYKIRWGVIFYDGLGARMVLNPTFDGSNKVAQKAVIDFGRPGFGENFGGPSDTGLATPLNSWLPFWITGKQHSNNNPVTANARAVPWWNVSETTSANQGARQARALRLLRDYLGKATDVPQWVAPDAASTAMYGLGTAESPINSLAIYNDAANVLKSSPPAGCRRNFGIMLLDGHGSGPIPVTTDSNYVAATDALDQGKRPWQIAQEIALMGRNQSVTPIPETNLRNQIFAIHFGAAEFAAAHAIADAGYEGAVNSIPLAFEAAPGGVINDLSGLYAAFASIFQLILDGTYLGSTPTITRVGDVRLVSKFQIQNCTNALPSQCNIGRIGSLVRDVDVNKNGLFSDDVAARLDFGQVLRTRAWSDRRIYTSYNATDANFCADSTPCTGPDTVMTAIQSWTFPGNGTTPLVAGTDYDFMLGNQAAGFANGVARGDTRNNAIAYALTGGAAVPLTDPFKLMDIANSRPVVVGAPTGIGEDVTRWGHFRGMQKRRFATNGGDGVFGPLTTVGLRDEMVYIGGNDGVLHAFLSRRHNPSLPAQPGRVAKYDWTTPSTCAIDTGTPVSVQNPQSNCLGMELWGYTPKLLHNFWGSIRGGHYFMVDGSPIVSDVLFTKGNNAPLPPVGATACDQDGEAACNTQWEYRTVLLQCLGGGGPGCFALDVSNPYDPRLLWERSLNSGVTVRQTTTSRPQIARMRKFVGGVGIPYYVALMGGGMGETQAAASRGTFIAVGLEDGLVKYSDPLFPANAAFAGAPSCLDTDNDSFTDTCYISTQDASIYKVRFPNGDPTQPMTMSLFFDGRARLLALTLPGSSGPGAVRSYSRVVATLDRNRDLRIFFGTGNFEDVQNATERNYMFELRDPDPASSVSAVNGSNCGSGTGVLALSAGEKIIFDPVIASGSVLFTSFAPDPNPCLPGDGYLYGVSYDACAPALDDPLTAPTTQVTRIDFPNTGLPSAPIVNERTGSVSVGRDDGTVSENVGLIQTARQLSVTKLWWRVVR